LLYITFFIKWYHKKAEWGIFVLKNHLKKEVPNMLKKMLLSAALTLSALATAQINLDLDLQITHEEAQANATGSVAINEDEVTSVMFNNLESLVIDFVAQQKDENVVIHARFFQKIENDELLPIVEDWLSIKVAFEQKATFTINEQDGNGSLVLEVIPSLIQ
jgi:hypothetical protein